MDPAEAPSNPERDRLEAQRQGQEDWRLWGPYVSERAWGTVREDYSPDGEAWNHFGFDQALTRAFRWGEDGIAGICDREQRLCLALTLWNGRDPILKERLFGLTGKQGNCGEDVKECYFHLDATPSHCLRHSYATHLIEAGAAGPRASTCVTTTPSGPATATGVTAPLCWRGATWTT